MPRFDGSGPLGSGPGTGWGMGPCGAGMGYGRGRGFGRGFGFRRFYTKNEEADILKKGIKSFKKQFDDDIGERNKLLLGE